MADASVVATVMEQLLQNVQKVHAIGIVHRDLKPANIIFSEASDTFKANLTVTVSPRRPRQVDHLEWERQEDERRVKQEEKLQERMKAKALKQKKKLLAQCGIEDSTLNQRPPAAPTSPSPSAFTRRHPARSTTSCGGWHSELHCTGPDMAERNGAKPPAAGRVVALQPLAVRAAPAAPRPAPAPAAPARGGRRRQGGWEEGGVRSGVGTAPNGAEKGVVVAVVA